MRAGWVLLLCLLCMACARQPDAEAIRERIGQMAGAAEAKSAGDLLDGISEDFIGNGELDRARLASFVRGQLLTGNAIGVDLGTIEVDVRGDRATARFQATLTDGSGRWIPDRRATLDIETGWRREGGEWTCYNATWSRDGR
jgi:hypothetical protein